MNKIYKDVDKKCARDQEAPMAEWVRRQAANNPAGVQSPVEANRFLSPKSADYIFS